ncbi:MAG: hypothetical protein AB2807_07410 [Candidatus Sedimenticola endophacoides]
MAGELSLCLGYRMHGLQSLSAEILVGGVGKLTALATGEVPEVRRVDIRYTLEPEYIKALIGHCAGQGGVTPQHFVNGLFQQESGHYLRTLGIVPGPGLMEALKELVTQGGEVRLRAEPAPGLKPQALQGYRPEDAVRMLGLSVSVNERPVTDLSYSHQGGGRDAAARAEAGSAPEEAARRPQRQYYAPVWLDQLERYLGRPVKVFTKDSETPKEGILDAVQGDRLSVLQRLYGGSMTAIVRKELVTRVEVLQSR